ncbi:MAG: mechanosensitive ion channel [Alphaproteobacteria bacterium]|nr:mechanosensitive ion channel [Alphaproteobacteria bacterium]
MELDLEHIIEVVTTTARSVGVEIASPYFYLQFGLMVAIAGIAVATQFLLRKRVDVTALGSGLPAPLRHFVQVMVRGTAAAVFTLLVIVARVVMYHTTWHSRSYLLMVAAKLGLAWLVIRLVTSVLRNAFLGRVVSVSAWIVAALSIIGQLEAARDLLSQPSIQFGDVQLTPLLLINAGALLITALWLTNIVSDFIESRITRASDLTPSIQVLLVKMIRMGLMIVTIGFVLRAVGIDLTAFAVFSGAVGVGLGFGLQKIVANFISGIILLVDKSVKPGDIVTIGDNTGRISTMKTRYISVASGDGREILVPNEDLVTQKVINWTFTNKNILVKIPFATNYKADPRHVCKLAIDTAARHPRLRKGMRPNCVLTEFAETGMKFSLTLWLSDPDGMDGVKSDVMLALWDNFKREGIKVPYPVREIRLRSGQLPEEMVEPAP